jgi:hypothetical protein
MTKIRLKPPKYLGGRVSTYLVILGAKCHFSKIGYRECNFVIPRGGQCIPFSFYFPSSTKVIQKKIQGYFGHFRGSGCILMILLGLGGILVFSIVSGTFW